MASVWEYLEVGDGLDRPRSSDSSKGGKKDYRLLGPLTPRGANRCRHFYQSNAIPALQPRSRTAQSEDMSNEERAGDFLRMDLVRVHFYRSISFYGHTASRDRLLDRRLLSTEFWSGMRLTTD